MTIDPNAISPTPETSGGEDGNVLIAELEKIRAGLTPRRAWWITEAIGQHRALVRRVAELASRLSPPSSSGEDGEGRHNNVGYLRGEILRLRGVIIEHQERESAMEKRTWAFEDVLALAADDQDLLHTLSKLGWGQENEFGVRLKPMECAGLVILLGKLSLTSRHPHSGETQ